MIGLSLGWKMETIPGFASTSRFHPYEVLRQNIIAKNQLFFHRWRPQNSTYLFLFRKHEQGKNAQEIPKFDPLIEAEEEKIATLRNSRRKILRPEQLAQQAEAESSCRKNPRLLSSRSPIPPSSSPTRISKSRSGPRTRCSPNRSHMNFDAHGRLWVASSSVYPQIEPGQAPDDKILILEDTNGDGKADKTTVFADGLLIPTGVEPGDGGVLRRPEHRAAALQRHRWRRQGGPAARGAQRFRHRGHASHSAHVALGTGRPALHEPVDLHPQPHRDAARRGAAEQRRHLRLRPDTHGTRRSR